MTSRLGILAVALLLIGHPALSRATTITFENAAGGDNSPIPTTYGSNVTANATGFVTTDGTGATPDIALTWDNSPLFWEYHTSTVWSALGTPVHVAQLDNQNTGNSGSLLFTPTASVAVEILSFDIGNATDQTENAYSWTINVINQTSSAVVATRTTTLLGAGNAETVTFNFTGELGQAYLLEFDPSVKDSYRTAIANLSFAQAVPEPSALAIGLSGLACGVWGGIRRWRARQTAALLPFFLSFWPWCERGGRATPPL